MQEESRVFKEVFWAKFDDDLRQMMNNKSNILIEISPPQDVPLKKGGLREGNLLLEFRHILDELFCVRYQAWIWGK